MSATAAKTSVKKNFLGWTLSILVFSAALLAGGVSFAQAPHTIAGITLGNNISHYKNMLQTDSAMPIRHMEYLTEIEMKPFDGYKSGYIFYGNCDVPGRIIKVKLKFDREDREFFDQLLELYRKRFGKTCEYKGDPFRAFIVWKWSFKDENNNTISLILQHNSVDEDEFTSGNSVKLSITNLMEKERLCYEKAHPEEREPAKAPSGGKTTTEQDMKKFVPE